MAEHTSHQSSTQYFERVTYGAFGVGLMIVAAGILYVIQFEGRISKLEAQLTLANAIPPASAATDTAEKPVAKSATGAQASSESIGAVNNAEALLAIARGCEQLMTTFNTITGKSTLWHDDKERLAILSDQMEKLGCTNLLK